VFFVLICMWSLLASSAAWPVEAQPRQITFGPAHHFFGYIGQAGNTPGYSGGATPPKARTDQRSLNECESAPDFACLKLLPFL